MKVNMTIADVLNTLDVLKEFVKKNIAMPGKLSWDIYDNMEKLTKIADRFQEKRDAVGKKYIEEGKTYKNDEGSELVKEEFIQAFRSEIQDILMIEREIDFIGIPSSEIRKVDGLSVMDARALSFMVEK